MNGIIYLTYNSADDIRSNWDSLVDNIALPTVVHVIDNASTDDGVDLLENSGIPVRSNAENIGYSAGINQGLRHLLDKDVDEFIFIVNPDVKCLPEWDKLLTEPLTDIEDCGIIGARLTSRGGSILHSGGKITTLPTLLLWPMLYPVTDNLSVVSKDGLCATHFVHDTIDYTEPQKCPWVTFAIVALRVSMIKDIGLLDETYFLYSSDSQYCMRAWQAGWDTWYNPITFEHSRSASLQKASNTIQEQGRRDMLRFVHEEESSWLRLQAGGLPRKIPKL